jgi:hypothetical protein
MSRSLLARPLEPLVAISWGVLLVWTAWMAAVWMIPVNHHSLKLPFDAPTGWSSEATSYVEDRPQPPYADLRRAVLVLAKNAELAWLALALIQLHLAVISTNGVNTARTWLAIAAGGAFLLGAATHAFGIPFGWMFFSKVLGSQLLGVPLGWLLLWVVLLIAAREAILRIHPRAGHLLLTSLAAGAVLLTMVNLNPVAENVRAWWVWHAGDIHRPATAPWWSWIAWFASAWAMLFLMREKSVAAAAAHRSVKPLVILLLLNFAAFATHLRGWFRG